MSPTLDDLIARLEKLTGPDRQLDGLIFKTLYQRDEDMWTTFGDEDVWHRRDPSDHCAYDPPPNYTACMADAVTLVRSMNFYWVASEGKTRETEPLGGVQIFRRNHLVTPLSEAEHEKVEIALCIAALKARRKHSEGGTKP